MGWKGVLLFFLSFLLAVSLSATILGLQGLSLLKAETYTHTLEERGFYAEIASSIGGEVGRNFFAANNESIGEIFNTAIKQAFDYINGRSEVLNLTIDLKSDGVKKAIIEQINNLPVCEDMLVQNGSIDSACRPRDMTAEEAYNRAMQDGVIPSEQSTIDLGQYLNKDGSLTALREKVRTYKILVYSAVLLSIVLIALILLVGWSSRSRGLRSVGVPIIISGMGILTGTYAGFAIALQTISSYETLGGEFNLILILGDILAGLKMRLVISGIVLIIVGLIVFVSSFIFARKDESQGKEK